MLVVCEDVLVQRYAALRVVAGARSAATYRPHLSPRESPAKGMSGLYRRIEPKEAVRCIAMCIVVIYRCFRELLKKAASPSVAVRVKGVYPTGLFLPCANV